MHTSHTFSPHCLSQFSDFFEVQKLEIINEIPKQLLHWGSNFTHGWIVCLHLRSQRSVAKWCLQLNPQGISRVPIDALWLPMKIESKYLQTRQELRILKHSSIMPSSFSENLKNIMCIICRWHMLYVST